MQYITILILLLTLCFSNTSIAQDSYPLQNLDSLLPLAEKGVANIQNDVAIRYMLGNGTPQNLNKAFVWFEKAANQNHAEAQYHYATFILNGYATTKSPEKAIPWFRKSALQGNVKAQNSLGILHMIGLGTKIDYVESFKWNEKAAQGGVADAMYNLAQQYEKGAGVDKNSYNAVYWYEQAAKQGHPLAEFELGVAHEFGLGGYERSIPKAMEWYEKAANQNNMFAQSNLANLYSRSCDKDELFLIRTEEGGKSIQRNNHKDKCNPKLAASWYRKAAELGLPKAQFMVGAEYLIAQNFTSVEGMQWIEKAAANGSPAAKDYIEKEQARIQKEIDRRKDVSAKISKTWAIKSNAELIQLANRHDPDALDHLGVAYEFGLFGLEKNTSIAIKHYLQRVGLKDASLISGSQANLDHIYTVGLQHSAYKINSDYLNAKLKIEDIAKQGDLTAIKFLARFYNSQSCNYFSSQQSRIWYEKAANLNDRESKLALARNYSHTFLFQSDADGKPDYEKSLYWYQQIDLNNKPNAQYELAKLYLDDKSKVKNPGAAISLLQTATESNHIDAKFYLASLYKEGKSITKDREKAISLYKELAALTYAPNRGNELFKSAANSLAGMYNDSNEQSEKRIDAHVWYTLAKEVSQRKYPVSASPIPPNSSPRQPGMYEGDLAQCSVYSEEFDAYPGRIFLSGGTLASEKSFVEKLTMLEKQMSSDEIKAAKITLEEWKSKWALQK